jgi:hypothetical protein
MAKSDLLSLNHPLMIRLSTPASVALAAYLILAIVIVLPFEFPIYDERTQKQYIVKYNLAERLIMLLMMLLPLALSVYSINCMMVGNCEIWSYIVALLSVFWVAIFVIVAFFFTFSARP